LLVGFPPPPRANIESGPQKPQTVPGLVVFGHDSFPAFTSRR
jgi:hypothetical protein